MEKGMQQHGQTLAEAWVSEGLFTEKDR